MRGSAALVLPPFMMPTYRLPALGEYPISVTSPAANRHASILSSVARGAGLRAITIGSCAGLSLLLCFGNPDPYSQHNESSISNPASSIAHAMR
jgi:hypothetical protein